MDFPELRAAGEALRSVCDGAQSRDDTGYNGFDRSFADSLLDKAPWTPRMASAFHKMLLKYRKQLAGLGHPYEGIPRPDATPTFTPAMPGVMDPSIFQTPAKPNIGLARHPTYGLQFTVEFPLNYSVKDAFRANIPVTIWQPEDLRWVVPGKHAEALLAFAKTVGWTWTDEAFTEATHRGVTLAEKMQANQVSLKMSSASDSTFMADFTSKSGFKLYPYQRAGAEYLVKHERSYLADSMRLGKTVQVMAAAHHVGFKRMLVICPSSVTSVWQRHVAEWLPGKRVTLAPAKVPAEGVYVTSYDRASRMAAELKQVQWDIVVCDEAHKLKNRTAKRTQNICGSFDKAAGVERPGLLSGVRYRWLLTGTAVEKKPAELIQPLIGIDRLRDFGGFKGFAGRYCGWMQGVPGSIDGARNLPELNERLRATCWVRRTMDDVYTSLPEKTYEHVPLPLKDARRYKMAVEEVMEELSEDDRTNTAEAIVKMTLLRRIAAEEKVEAAISWVEDFLENGNKLVLLGWHNEPLRAIYKHFQDQAVILTGETSAQDRIRAMDNFQTKDSIRLFVGNIQAAGEGIELSAASDVAIFELPWNSSTLDQGIARILRPGKTTRMGIHYLLAEGTIDVDIAALVDEKRAIATSIHDGKEAKDSELVSLLLGKLKATYVVRHLGPSKPGVIPLPRGDEEAWA